MSPTAEQNVEGSMVAKEEVCYRFHSKEGREFTLSKSAAHLSVLVKQMVPDLGIDDDEEIKTMRPIPLINVGSEALALVVKWCEHHKTMPAWEEEKWWLNERDAEMRRWEREFITAMSPDQLFNVFSAANYMDIKCLFDKCAEAVADMARGKSVEEIREVWILENDFTPEEQEKMNNENPWTVVLRDIDIKARPDEF
ncbi:unnamed protein product, partial [Mesorhabditis spiculigera]